MKPMASYSTRPEILAYQDRRRKFTNSRSLKSCDLCGRESHLKSGVCFDCDKKYSPFNWPQPA